MTEGTALRKRHSPGDFNTVERRWARERAAFARAMAPILEGLHRAGARTNGDQAERLNALGVPSEHGRPWAVQTVAAVRRRLVRVVPQLEMRGCR